MTKGKRSLEKIRKKMEKAVNCNGTVRFYLPGSIIMAPTSAFEYVERTDEDHLQQGFYAKGAQKPLEQVQDFDCLKQYPANESDI